MPEGAIYVGRGTRFGNPFLLGLVACSCRSVGECTHNSMRRETRAEAVESYRDMPRTQRRIDEIRGALRGKNLACWCPLDQPCHADVLLEIANA